ncbi:MAG: galactonate dehydratase [Oscillospiraceae bacterium]|jgi:galactonate dehydratase|nr:galactonate dehydratase [Oscillospiraceae bacterium]
MKIRSIELFQVPPRWLFLKMTTESGLAGWGEPVVEGRAATVAACVREMSETLVGKSAGDIEDAFQTLYRTGFYRGGPILTSALSGIEQAMWDIKGKFHNMPVYEFLGGKVRDRIEVYRWIGGDHPRDTASGALEALAQGYRAVKMNATDQLRWIDTHDLLDATVARVAAIRDAVGDQLCIAVDFHGRVHKTMAKTLMRKLEPYNLMFVEEPVLTENEDEFLELARSTHIPIATGERNFTRWGFKRMLTRGGIDVIQPDVSHCGGILETRKIASMAEAFDVALAPHCPLGPIALAACLQVDFCSPNAFIQEQSAGIHYNEGYDLLNYLSNPEVFDFRDGYAHLPTKPGLGVDVNEDYVRKMAREGHNWHNPIWRDSDGVIAEW